MPWGTLKGIKLKTFFRESFCLLSYTYRTRFHAKYYEILNILNSLPHILLFVLLLHLLYLRTWSVMQPFPQFSLHALWTRGTRVQVTPQQLLGYLLNSWYSCLAVSVWCMWFSLSSCICTNKITHPAVGCIDAIKFSCRLITGSFECRWAREQRDTGFCFISKIHI